MWIKIYIKVSLNRGKKKGKEFIILAKALFSKEAGRIILSSRDNLFCLMEIHLSVLLEIIIATKESINIEMEIFIKENGREKSKVETEN